MSDASTASLLRKTASGAGWIVGFRLLVRLLGIVSTLILAHLLGPGDYGLVAFATGFVQTIDTLTNLSAHEAIVRERNPDRELYDTAFTMSLARGLLTAAAVAALAVPAAGFFGEDRLVPVLLALAVSGVIGSAENITTADFMRTFAFRKEFQLWILPRILQTALTIGCALLWQSYWALVFGIVAGRAVRTVLSYAMRPYWPGLSLRAWRRILGYTTWSWATYLVGSLRDRFDTLLIGRLFSTEQVGVYALGTEVATLPTTELVQPLCRAAFPSFAQMRHDGTETGPVYARLIGATAIIVLPAGLGIAAVADPLVKLAFGARWVDAVGIIQILGVAGSLAVIGQISGTLLSAFGMLRTNFAITLAMTTIRTALLLLLLPRGSLLTAGEVVAGVTVLEQCIYLGVTARRFGFDLRALAVTLHRIPLCAGIMALCMGWLGVGFVASDGPHLLHLLTGCATGAAIYAASLLLLWQLCGRPAGPEADACAVAGRLWRRASGLVGAKLQYGGS